MHSVFLSSKPGSPGAGVVKVTPKPLPRWAADLIDRRVATDRGLGDLVAREVAPFGSEQFKHWYATIAPDGVFSKTCNCQQWQGQWNGQWPFDKG